MKRKLFTSLVIISLAIFVAIIIFIGFDIINPSSLWVKYIIMLSLIILGLSLNFSFKKMTDFDETVASLKRIVVQMEKINFENKATKYVKFFTISNQLNTAISYLEEIIATHELYPLRYDLSNLQQIKNRYSSDDNYGLINKEQTQKDIEVLKSIMSATKKYQSLRK